MKLKKIISYILKIIFLSIIIFFFISFLFNKNESPSDGDDSFGWPLVYYTYLGGKRIIEGDARSYFNQVYLMIDILITILISLGIITVLNKFISSQKK